MKLFIDVRENIKLRNLVEESPLFKDVSYEFKTLDIGDYLFVNSNDKSVFIIERKEISDLAKSITSKKKRYHEQKYRMCNNTGLEKTRIMYLIEGYQTVSGERIIHGLPKDNIIGCFVNTIARDQIQVYHTGDFNETLLFLSKLYHSLIKHAVKKVGGETGPESRHILTGPEYSDIGRLDGTTKNSKMTPELVFRYQLMSYPGISPEAAKIIESKYHSFPELINAWSSHKGDPATLLADIVVHGKRLGSIRSKRLFEYFFMEKKD